MQAQASRSPVVCVGHPNSSRSITDRDIAKLVPLAAELLQQHKWRLVTAESCTGGWLAKVITDMPGSSAWLERGFVTYSEDAKQELLGVAKEVLVHCGAVSTETVLQMAQGALLHSHADVAIAITGIAGPDGGSVNKPVGTVWFAWAMPICGEPNPPPHSNLFVHTECKCFSGDRAAIRRQAVHYSLKMLIMLIDRSSNVNKSITTKASS